MHCPVTCNLFFKLGGIRKSSLTLHLNRLDPAIPCRTSPGLATPTTPSKYHPRRPWLGLPKHTAWSWNKPSPVTHTINDVAHSVLIRALFAGTSAQRPLIQAWDGLNYRTGAPFIPPPTVQPRRRNRQRFTKTQGLLQPTTSFLRIRLTQYHSGY